MTDDLRQINVAISAFFFDNSVEHVFGTPQNYLSFDHLPQMFEVALHLKSCDALVFGVSSIGFFLDLLESLENLAQIAHIDSSFVEKELEGLRVGRHTLKLLQVLHQTFDGVFFEELGYVFKEILLLFEFIFWQINRHVALE